MEPRTILVVDDDRGFRQLVKDQLFREGLVVREATDGKEGLTLALHEHPDLIISDIAMPNMDGLTMLKQLRADSWGKRVPIVLLTNREFDGRALLDVMENEPSYYIGKFDVDLGDLMVKVKELLGG